MPSAPQDTVVESTRSVCPKCLLAIDATIVAHDDLVLLRKRCPTHGKFEVLLSSDSRMYLDSLPFNKPGQKPLGFSTEVKEAVLRIAAFARNTDNIPA